MYFIEKEEDLVGKIIAFTHMAQFADAITLGTTDGGILVVEMDSDSDGFGNSEVRIYPAHQTKKYILDNSWMRRELVKTGVISQDSIEEYDKEQKRINLERIEKAKKEQEKREYEQYLKLKEKYEQ